MSRFLKVRGISRTPRDGDSRRLKVLQVHFNHEPTGEQMDEFMAYALAFVTAEQRASKPEAPGKMTHLHWCASHTGKACNCTFPLSED